MPTLGGSRGPCDHADVNDGNGSRAAHEACIIRSIGVGDGMQLGVHAALGSADQAAPLIAGSPFFDRRLVAVRCALR